MIRIHAPELEAPTAARLADLQRDVDGRGEYAARVAAAKELFPQHNRGDRLPFREVRAALTRMCSGLQRCMYCEDAPADEVEHFRPKDLYPEAVFAWGNLLFACGPCNGPKNSQFRVFHPPGSATAVDVTRARGAAVVPPVAGDPMLIDPRTEDPLEFLWLDLATFYFGPRPGLAPRDRDRARYTLEVLRLNARDYLVRGRRNAFTSLRNQLRAHAARRSPVAVGADRPIFVESIEETNHATVWAEMKRQRALHDELRALFEQAPEAVLW